VNLDGFEELFPGDETPFYSDETKTLVSDLYRHLMLQGAIRAEMVSKDCRVQYKDDGQKENCATCSSKHSSATRLCFAQRSIELEPSVPAPSRVCRSFAVPSSTIRPKPSL